MAETRNRLLDAGKDIDTSKITLERMEDIHKKNLREGSSR